MTDALPDPAPPRRRRWLRAAGVLVGLLLVAAAVATVAREHEPIADALREVRRPRPGPLALLAAGVAANVALSGLLFSHLVARYGRVGLVEMQALVASATLMNFLPLRPGMFGRLAYHKIVNGIPARDSVRVLVQAFILSAGVAGFVALAAATCAATGVALIWGVLAGPALLALALPFARARHWAIAALIRYVELLAWAARYVAAFALLDRAVPAEAALAMACASMIAMLVPLVGNGLGLREWAIGLLAPWLAGATLELGLAADLVNRAVELLVVGGLGALGTAWLVRRRRAGHVARRTSPPV